MVYLYTLPGLAFNMPQLSVPLIKGFLENNKISSHQIDLTNAFLNKCVKSSYFKKNYSNYFNQLSLHDKGIVSHIDESIRIMKSKRIDSDKIIKANENISKYLNIFGKYYDIEWNRRGLLFEESLSDVDKVIAYSYKKENSIFDDLSDFSYLNNSDIIYFSVQQPFQLVYCLRFCKSIKEKHSDIKIILGGDYITHIIKNCKELMSKFKYIDSIVLFGEHQYLLELISYYKNNTSYKINNTLIRINNRIIFNDIKKCDILDKKNYIPNFDDLDLNTYLSNIKIIPLTLNYGCYHSKCKFCSRYFYYNGYKKYDLSKIFDFIKTIYLKENIEGIYFIDECVPPDALIKLSKYLIDNSIRIKWMVETRIDQKLNNSKLVEQLYKSGCREISFGIESLSNNILKKMDKRIDLKEAKQIMKKFYLSGISVSATFMLGYPGENIISIYKTLNFIKKFKYIDTFGLGVFKYMRNSVLINESDIDASKDLNLLYRFNGDNYDYYDKKIKIFNKKKKIKRYSNIRDKLLYRTEFMYLDRKKFSLNYK